MVPLNISTEFTPSEARPDLWVLQLTVGQCDMAYMDDQIKEHPLLETLH